MAQELIWTEDVSEYRFNMAAETRAIFKDYPQLDGNSIFVSTHDPLNLIGNTHGLPNGYLPLLPHYVANCIQDSIDGFSSKAFWRKIPDGPNDAFDLNVVVLIPTLQSDLPERERERHFRDFFVLNHEAGHLLLRWSKEDNAREYPYSECLADAFATIRAIQKFGADDPIFAKLGASRSLAFIASGEYKHLTSPVTFTILEHAQSRDFSNLTPAETLQLAKGYAMTFTPVQSDLNRAVSDYAAVAAYVKQEPDFDKMKLLHLTATSCLSTANRFSFMLGATCFQPLMNQQGALLKEEPLVLSPYDRDRMIDTFAARARHFNLYDFAALLEQNKSDMLPPRRQQQALPQRVTLALTGPKTSP